MQLPVPGPVSDHGVPRPIGSRVVALAAALVLCCAWALFALFALWPAPPGAPAGLGAVAWELGALVLLGISSASLIRWAMNLHRRPAVLTSWLLGLTPCLVVVILLFSR